MASRPPQRSQTDRGWAAERRRELLLGALAGALVLVGGLAGWAGFALVKKADRPSPSAVNVPEAAPAGPEQPPQSAVRPSPASEFVRELSGRPLEERLASGPDRILLRLRKPAPDGVTVSLRDTVTSRSFSRTLPEGSLEADFTGLNPAREHRLEVSAGSTRSGAKVSRDGGRSFTDGKPPIESGYLSGSEALCLGPGGFLLANVEYVMGTRQDIWARMMVSPDGLGWKTLARPGLPMGLYMGALARPVAGRLVFASITIDEGLAVVTAPLP
jgi:hypothetical protein